MAKPHKKIHAATNIADAKAEGRHEYSPLGNYARLNLIFILPKSCSFKFDAAIQLNCVTR